MSLKRYLVFILMLASLVAIHPQAKKSSARKCPPVQAKNPEEAVMMESSSNKNGCWARDPASGQLVFLSDLAPDKNYVPMMEQPPPGTKPVCSARRPGAPANDLSGTWLVTVRCVSHCDAHPGASPEELQMLETVTISRRVPRTYRISFGTFPNMDGCETELTLLQKPNLIYSGTSGVGTNELPEGCHPRTVEIESRGSSFIVRTRYESGGVWEGLACPTSAPPGAWLPQAHLENGKVVYSGGNWLLAQ